MLPDTPAAAAASLSAMIVFMLVAAKRLIACLPLSMPKTSIVVSRSCR